MHDSKVVVEGVDLAHVIAERGCLPVHEAVDYMLQTCAALADRHAAGRFDASLEPKSLYLATSPDGRVGVKLLGPKEDAPARDARYSAPELLGGGPSTDPRTDIWSVGAVLYELLAGQSPFDAPTVDDVRARIASTPPAPLVREDLPLGLAAVVTNCLEKTPTRRFANVAELAQALKVFAPAASGALVDGIERIVYDPRHAPSSARFRAVSRATRARATTVVVAKEDLPQPLGARGSTSRLWLLGGAVAGLGLVGLILLVVALTDRGDAAGGGSPPRASTSTALPSAPKPSEEPPAAAASVPPLGATTGMSEPTPAAAAALATASATASGAPAVSGTTSAQPPVVAIPRPRVPRPPPEARKPPQPQPQPQPSTTSAGDRFGTRK